MSSAGQARPAARVRLLRERGGRAKHANRAGSAAASGLVAPEGLVRGAVATGLIVMLVTSPVWAQSAAPASSDHPLEVPEVSRSASEPLTTPGTTIPRPPPSPGPSMVHEPLAGLFIAGAVVFGVSYGFALLASFAVSVNGFDVDAAPCGSCKSDALKLAIPVAGPLILDAGSSPGDRSGWLLLWSGVEAAGMAMLIWGLVGHDVPQTPSRAAPESLSIAPSITPRGGMFSLGMRW